MTVKHLSLDYKKVNERGSFSPGDVLSGWVTVVTSKETKVQSFWVKAKGKAKVTWCDQEGQTAGVHSDKKTYFHFEHIILQDKNKGDGLYCFSLTMKKIKCNEFNKKYFALSQGSEVIGPGRNVYPFTFVIPKKCVC